MTEWRVQGETVFADWFQHIYLSSNWDGWWCGAAGIEGIAVTNNPLESYNRNLKRVIQKVMFFPRFINSGIPSILEEAVRTPRIQRRDIMNKEVVIQTTNKPREMMEKALLILTKKQFLDKRSVVYFNSGSFVDIEVTDERSYLFEIAYAESKKSTSNILSSSNSWFEDVKTFHKKTDSFQHVKNLLRSLHRVAWNGTFCTCSCKMFQFTSYACSHVLVVYHLRHVFDLVKNIIQDKNKPGRPSKRSKGLDIDAEIVINFAYKDRRVYSDEHGSGYIVDMKKKPKIWTALYTMEVQAYPCPACPFPKEKAHIPHQHLRLSEKEVLDQIASFVKRFE